MPTTTINAATNSRGVTRSCVLYLDPCRKALRLFKDGSCQPRAGFTFLCFDDGGIGSHLSKQQAPAPGGYGRLSHLQLPSPIRLRHLDYSGQG